MKCKEQNPQKKAIVGWLCPTLLTNGLMWIILGSTELANGKEERWLLGKDTSVLNNNNNISHYCVITCLTRETVFFVVVHIYLCFTVHCFTVALPYLHTTCTCTARFFPTKLQLSGYMVAWSMAIPIEL